MAGARPLIVGIALMVLFGYALFTFMLSMTLENNPNSQIVNNAFINSTRNSLGTVAENIQETSENAKETLESDKPSAVYVFLILFSAFAIPISFMGAIIPAAILILVTAPFVLIFGQGGSPFYIAFMIVGAVTFIGIVFSLLRAIRSGETER